MSTNERRSMQTLDEYLEAAEFDGGAAFPVPFAIAESGYGCQHGDAGMRMRDYFAAKALQAIAANLSRATGIGENLKRIAELNAELAYMQADAMLKAKAEKP